ncbi:MAG: porin [Ignavibacteria bacterium]
MKAVKITLFTFLISAQIFAQKIGNTNTTLEGFVQPIYKLQLSNNKFTHNEFLINRFRLGAKSKINDRFDAVIEIDPLDQNLLVKDAKIGFNLNQNFTLYFGRQKIPFSRERLISVKNIQYFERTKVVKEFNDLAFAGRDIGLLASFYTKIEKIKVNLTAGIFNGNKGDLDGDYNNSKTYAQRLEINYKNLSFGINSTQKFDSLTSKYFVANGFDFEIDLIDNLSFSSEILLGRKDSSTMTGGEYFSIEYKINDFVFGTRFSQYFSNIKKSPSNFFEAKIDYRPLKEFRLSINWLTEKKSSKFENTLILGASYVL